MAIPTKIIKSDRVYHVKDDTKRPLTVYRVRFHPTERRLLAVVVDCRLAVWDLDGPAVTDSKAKNNGPVVVGMRHCDHEVGWLRDCALSPDGKLLATSGSDRRVRLWRWAEGKPEDRCLAEARHDGWVEAVGFAPDGQRVASVGSDRTLKLWNAADLKPLNAMPSGHAGIPRDLVWTRDGKYLATGGEDGTVLVRDGQSLEVVHSLAFGETNEQQGQHPQVSGVHRLAVSRDNRWLAVSGDRKIALFDLVKGVSVAGDALRSQAAFHPAADVLAAGGDTVKVLAFEAAKFAALTATPGKNSKTSLPGKELGSIKLGDFSLGLDFSPDGQSLAVGKSNGTVEVWNVS